MAKLLEEVHRGEILLEDFTKPKGTGARQPLRDSSGVVARCVVPPGSFADRRRASVTEPARAGAAPTLIVQSAAPEMAAIDRRGPRGPRAERCEGTCA